VRVVEELLFVAFIQSVVVDGKELNLGVDLHPVAAIFPKSWASPAGAARRPAVLWMVFVMIALPVVEVDRSRPRLRSHSPPALHATSCMCRMLGMRRSLTKPITWAVRGTVPPVRAVQLPHTSRRRSGRGARPRH
jgi:hypothetical protein